MKSLQIDNKTELKIISIANILKTTEIDVIIKAIDYYLLNLEKKKKLLSLAGSLSEDEADKMLKDIYKSRKTKKSRTID
ncbi:MAG: hypothetical protein KA792_08270 [Bacteroidales bacterium]|nr:hypothetical protein [Bacteroidales bacterium]